ncbi:MAG TPA: DNA repair exonuclease [Methylocystis sp.]|nr:DNA repair exonuclease [Methylocystis sp.]
MSFTFIHAADLHIDSPLDGLGCKDAAVAARFAEAGRRAVSALIDLAITSKAAFLLISGDIFDGDWRDVSTGHFFVKELGRLARENIKVFIVRGNHDAESQISKSLPYPSNVHVFSSRSAQTHPIEELRVALHGRSFSARNPDADFVSSYPARCEGWFNIGLLHTALDGSRKGHNSYAPCTVEDLRRFGYDYWALGHIHAREEVCGEPYIVYPGNLQGRNVRETGAKGATRVEVADGRVASLAHVPLDGARWAHLRLDAGDCADEAQLLATIEGRLGEEHAKADGRALALRLTLTGATALHERLVARREAIEDDARALALRFGDDFWIEQLKIATNAPKTRSALGAADALDVEALILKAADERYAQSVAELMEEIVAKAPREVGEALRRDLDAAALANEARDLLLGELAIATVDA